MKLDEKGRFPIRKEERITHQYAHLDDGRTISLFVNRDTNLVVLDVVDADEEGGVEVYRRNL
jgi:hypothetical protein